MENSIRGALDKPAWDLYITVSHGIVIVFHQLCFVYVQSVLIFLFLQNGKWSERDGVLTEFQRNKKNVVNKNLCLRVKHGEGDDWLEGSE